MAPATGFFQALDALAAVNTPVLAWAGTSDTVTPPEQAEFLKHALGARVPVEVRVIKDAGHFSFMNTPPPGTKETLRHREDFLTDLAGELCHFVRN
jgi:alpha-beta hydrolase superfamily lysophospholipase